MKTNSNKINISPESSRRKILFSIITLLVIFVICFGCGELIIRIFRPQHYLYPRWKFSSQYGSMLFENCKMIHACPGRWRFNYTINEYQYRGKLIPISNTYDKKNIVILGDSFSFGTGVNDGEEFAAIMAGQLKNDFNIINLSVGAWGLTQQIRRYYEFGKLYSPEIVILQFCANDPRDNFKNKVTSIEQGRFIFQNSNNTLNRVKKYLSKSIIQKSQIYNLVKASMYHFFAERIAAEAIADFKKNSNLDEIISPEEKLYNDLLELFAKDLNQNGVKLIMIAVNGQLNNFKYIKEKAANLNSNSLINYIEVIHWFENVTDYGSPEGHCWGKKAHYILGINFSDIILKNYK